MIVSPELFRFVGNVDRRPDRKSTAPVTDPYRNRRRGLQPMGPAYMPAWAELGADSRSTPDASPAPRPES